MPDKVTIPALQQMKREGKKSVGVVAWDYPMARIADRAGVDFVSVGDSVGVNLWGHSNPLEVTMEEMLIVCKAVRRGVTRALVSCDFPFGPLQEGTQSAVKAVYDELYALYRELHDTFGGVADTHADLGALMKRLLALRDRVVADHVARGAELAGA